MEKNLEIKAAEAWEEGLNSWSHPSVPAAIIPKTAEEINSLGEIGAALRNELAFMNYPDFQTYINLEKIASTFSEDPNRGARAVAKHELGHRFCPYDLVTSIILLHNIKQELNGTELPYDVESAARNILNLFTDTSINTTLARKGDEDIAWAYQQLSKSKADSKMWRVYARSNEIAWKKKLLPENAKLSKEEEQAAKELSELFEGNCLDRDKWRGNARTYARIISKFLEDEKKDGEGGIDNSSGNIPDNIDDKTAQELAKKLAEIGSNGIPSNPSGLKEFKEMMAGYGRGNPIEASIMFYDKLSDAYRVMFATRPFGRPRVNPFQPVKWNPSMGADKLDADYSVQVGGRIIPGVNTYLWKTRKRETRGGDEEVVPNLDLYLDSSMSMPNPVETISLPVLAGFVVAKKAHRKGAQIRSTNFSGDGQDETQDWTRDLDAVFRNLVTFFGGGTVFPVGKLLEGGNPKQVLVITDTYLGNEAQSAEAITELKKRHKGNKATIYAIHPSDNAEYLRKAGAEVINGTTADIFKRAIGKADEVYVR